MQRLSRGLRFILLLFSLFCLGAAAAAQVDEILRVRFEDHLKQSEAKTVALELVKVDLAKQNVLLEARLVRIESELAMNSKVLWGMLFAVSAQVIQSIVKMALERKLHNQKET